MQSEKAEYPMLVNPVKNFNSSKEDINEYSNALPKSVTAIASDTPNSPSPFVSHLATQIAFTLASAKLMIVSSVIETVTLQVAVILVPSVVLAVMTAVPFAFEVTTPILLTVATAVLLLVHVTFLLVVLEGATVAVSIAV